MYNKSSKKLLSTRDAAKLLGYTHDYISKMCREGLLEAQQIGRSWLIEEDAVEAFKTEQEERLKEYRLSAAERVSTAVRDTAPAKTSPTAPKTVKPSVRSPYFSKASSLAVPLVALLLIGSVGLASSGTVARSLADSRDALRASVFDAFSQAAQSPALFASTNGVLNSIFHAVSNVAVSFFTVQVAHAPTIERKNAPVVAAVQAPSLPGATTVNQYFSYVTQNPIQYIYGGVTMEYVRAAIDNVRNDLGDRGSSGGSSSGLADLSGSSIQDLSDVGSMTTAFGELLYWDGTTWTNIATSSLGISGSGTVTSVNASGGTTGLSFTGGAITTTGTLTLTGTLAIANGGTGTTTAPTYGQLLVGDGLGGYTLLATSSLGISGGTGTPGGSNGQVQYNNGGVLGGDAGFAYDAAGDRATITYASTTGISSLYASSTNASFGTLSIGSLGGLLKATAGVVSAATAGVDYESPLTFAFPLVRTVNALSLAFGTTTANTWSAQNTFSGLFATNASSTNATTSSLYITGLTSGALAVDANGQVYKGATTTAGTGLSYSGNAFSVQTTQNIAKLSNLATNGFVKTSGGDGTLIIDTNTYLTAAVTSIGPAGQLQTGPAVTIASSTIGSDFTVTASGNTITFNLPTASSVNRGALSAGDWSTFNNKISSTSLSAVYPLAYNSSTGAFTFGGLSTSSAAVVGNIPYFSGPNTFANVATSTVSNGTGISISGSAAVVGAGGLSITNTGVTSNVAGTGINVSGATGSVTITNTGVTSVAGTANQIAVSGATGSVTLSLPSLVIFPNAYRGTYGTTTYASSTALSSTYASSTSAFFGTLSVGSLSGILKATGGVVSAATAGVDYLTSALTSIGPAGSLQSGPAITFATTSAAFNGLTASTTITASGNTITFANTLAGILGVAGGGTGSTTLGGILTGNGSSAITSASISAPLTFSGNTLAITQAGTGANGYLSSTDFNTFNNKISSTSLSGGTGISYVSATGVITNTGVTSNVAGTGINVSGATGAVTITNTGVTSLAGTANQITASASTGAVTLSLPNSVLFPGTASSTAFSGLDYVAVGRTATTTIRGEANATSTFASAIDTTRGLNLNSGYIYGAGLSSCSGSSDKLLWNATTGQFSCGADAGAGGGITAIGPAGQYQTGSTQTLASSTSGTDFTITASGDILTFNLPSASASARGLLTSSDWSVFQNKISSTSLSAVYPLSYNSSTGVFSTAFGTTTANTYNALNTFNGGVTIGSLTGPLQAINGVVSASSTISVAYGGTGWSTIQANTLLLGNGAGAIGTTSQGTNGQVLALVSGVPTWVATSSINNGVASIQQTGGGTAQTGAITFATSSATSNGVTIGLNITNTGSAFTFTPTRSGTLTVAGGGTGTTTAPSGQLLYGGGAGVYQSVATSTFAVSGPFTTAGTIGFMVGGTNSTVTYTGLATTTALSASGVLYSTNGAAGVSSAATSTPTAVDLTISGTGATIGSLTILNPYAIATTSGITPGGLAYYTQSSGKTTIGNVATTTFTPSAEFTTTGTLGALIGGSNSTLGLANNGVALGKIAQIAANTILGNPTGATGNVQALATSTFFGAGQGGQVLTWNNGVPQWTATTTYSAPLLFAAGNVTITQSSTGANGYLSSTDFNTFNNKISSTSLSGGTGISYVSATGVITNTGVTSLAGTANQITASAGTGAVTLSLPNLVAFPNAYTATYGTTTYSSSTALSTLYASSTSAFLGNLSVGALNGPLQANDGVVSATTSILAIYGGTGQNSYSVGDLLYADSATSLTRLPVSTNGMVLKLVGGVPSWQPDLTTGGGGGAGAWSTTTDSLAIYPSDTSDVIIIGASATSTSNSILEVFGRSYFSNTLGIATTSASSLFKLAVQGSGLFSGNLSAANITATGTLAVSGQTTLGYASSTGFSTSYASSTSAFFGSLNVGSLSGLLKATNGAVSTAIAGTDYIAGGAGAATTTLTISGPFTTSATPVVFGSSPITSTYYGLATTSALSASGVLYSSNGAAGVASAATSTLSVGNGLTTTSGALGFQIGGSNASIGLAAIGANTVLANGTGGSAIPTAIATSTFFGTGTGGQVLTWANGVPTFTATTTFSAPLVFAAGNVTITQSSTGANGYLSSTDFNTFNNKISSTSLSGGTGISYVSATGVITNTGVTSLAGTANQITASAATGAVTLSLPTQLNISNASTTNLSANTFAVGGTGTTSVSSTGALTTPSLTVAALTGPLQAINGVVSASSTISVAYGGTGWSNIQANTLLLGNGAGAIGTTSQGTNGQVLALVSGVPTWVATSSINNGVASIQQTGGGSAQTGAITFATSSVTNNGVTLGLSITNTGSAFTFTPTRSGTLTVGGGGTGQTSLTSGQLIYGAGTNAVQSVATSTFAVSGPFTTSGTIGFMVGGSNSTVTYTGLATTTALSSSGVLYSTNGAAGVSSAATSTPTAVDLTINGSGATIGSLTILNPYAIATTSGITPGGLAYYTQSSGKTTIGNVATTTFTPSAEFTTTGTLGALIGGSNSTLGLANNGVALGKIAQIAANTILGNPTGASGNVQALATSSLFGTGTGGQVLTWNNGVPQWTATTTYSAPLLFAAGNVTITQAGTGANGYLSSTDFNTFNNKISSTSLSAVYPLSYNSSTGVFSTAFGTTTVNTYSASNVFNGGVTIGSLTGPLQAINGVVSASSTISVAYGGTGLSTAPTFGQILVGNSTGGYTLTATSSLGLITSAVQAIGPTGQTSSGPTVTFATTTSTANGQTVAITITGSGNTQTFTPSLSGTLTAAGGGTGSTTLGGILTGNGTGQVTSATVSAPLTFSGNTLAITQSSTGANGYLSSTDFNTFNNKISSTSLSGASVISYNSGTGVITTTGGTFGAGDYVFGNKVTIPYASSTAFSSGYASATSAFFGNLSVGSLSGVLKATAGVVSAATAGVDYENPLTFGYPLVRSVNAISLAFGTTTTNTWVHQIFNSLVATNASSTNATTSSLYVTGLSAGGVAVDTTGRLYGAATTTAGTGLTYSGNAFNVNTTQNISTLSNLTSNGLIKTSGGTGALSIATPGTDYIAGGAGAATTTLTISGPFTTSATPVVFGSSPITATYYGLATTSTLTSSQLLVSNGAAGVYGVSTTTASCAGTASCSAFTILGAAPITITGSGLAAYDAWTHPAAGQSATTSLMLFNGAASSTQLSATRAYFGGTATTTITGAGFVGVGSSSPWAQLSVNPTSTNGTAPAFAIGSSTATSFVVTNAGNVGIGTTSQLAKLTVDGSIILPNNNSYRMLDNAGNGVSILTMSTANNVGYSGSTVSGSMQFSVPNATGAFQFLTGAGLTNVLQITNAGNVGIGTTTPFAKLSIAGAAGGTTNLFAISTSTAGFATSTAVKVDSNGNLSLLNGTTLTTPALTVGSLNGLLKGTAGVVSTATAGTDYVAGGAGAATTTLSTSGVLSFNANPVVFGSSPISLSITQSGSGADGYLSSTDWTSFNSRLSTSTFALLKDWNITTNIFGQSSLTPTTTLNIAVSGTGTSTFAGGLEAWRQISAPYFVATSSTATSTFQGGALLALAGGNVGIGTANPTAGLELGSITAGRNQIINATEGPEMAPALEAANWTASDGWSAGGGSLVKIAGVGTGTITPSGTFTVVAGRTYKVVVTLSAASGNLYDQVGGVAGRENLAAGTHTQYITAITSGKIIFTAGAAVTGTITSLSVKELTPGTGDLTVNGKLTLMSGIYSSAGVGAIDINSELGTIGLAGAKASTAGYGLNVTGNILASANIYATGFSYQSTSYLYLSEAANTASIRNSTSQQTLRTYNTYTDASNYERSALSGVQGQSVNITAETAGTGADNLNIVLTPSGTGYTLLNGNVGIGTTSPYRKLSVQGDAGISGNLSAANVVATGTLNVSGQTTLATSLSGLLKATAGVVSTAVAGTDYLTSAFQNWGLTTNIFGQSSLAPTTTQNIAVSGIGTSTFAGGLEAWRSISAPYFVATSTTATSTFNGGALFAVSGGNVGIGTISPSLKLTVAGGQILVGPADSTNSFINFYNTNYKIGASTGLELYTNTSDRIRFIEGSTERARFDAGGNFGIGTTSPYAKLSVVGQIVGAYFTGTTTATSTFGGSLAVTEVNATSTFAGGIDLSDGCYAIDGNCIGVPGSDGTVNTGAAGYFAYYPSAGTTVDDQTALYLSATGDIGIGTNGPTNYGAGYTALTIDDTTSGRIDISSNGIVQGVLYNSGSTFRVGNVNPNSVALITDDTEQLIIDGSGNVTVTSLGSGLVKSTSGVLSNATAGVDYLAAYDAFTHPSSGVSATTSGLIISASSTIGNGSATGGLTVSGNSTTTGNAIATTFVGNGSSNTLLSQNGTPIVTADVAGNNIAVGLYNAASGGSNSAFGLNNTATAATFSSAFGFGNTASGYLSSAFGSQNTASNNTSMAFGASNNVSGVQAAAFGYAITNAVDNSVMIGPGNTSKLTILNTQKAGFGSTTPYANLSVHANAGETNTTLFAIGSSTASATSTLFSVSNTGSVQTALGSGLVKSTSGVLGLATVGTDYIAGGAGAATTTVTCAGTASCTGFVAFGASPITITGSGLASYDAWTHPAAGQSATTSLMLFNGNASSTQLSATRAYFGGTATTTITAAGFVGVGSSSPWAQLSVNPTSTNGTAPAFAIGSSTDTSFVVWNNGNVSIGTTTASTQKLTVAGTLRLDNGGGWAPLSGVNFQGIMSGGSYYFGKTFDSGNSGVFVYDNSGGYFTISNNNSTLDNGVKISDNLTVTGAATFANASTTNFSANTLAVGGTGTTSISSTGALTTPSLTIGSLSGLLKGTAGAVSVATPGTDYIAGGAGAATTTVSCSGSASCTSFVAFGSSPITISSSALTAYDAWTHPAAGQSATTSLMLFNGNASSTQLSAGTAYFGTTGTTTILGTGFVGVGTSSPWARLSINPIAADGAAPAFAIGSSTGTTFVVTNGGNVGIGTTSPQAPLHIQSDNGMRIQESSNVRYFYVTPPVAGADTVFGNNGTLAGFRFSNTSIGTFLTMNGSSGSVGIGTTTPFAKLSVAGSAGGTTNLFAVSTSTAGFSTSTALYVDSAGSLIAGLNGSKVGIGTTSPGAALEVKGSGTGSVLAGAWGGDSTYGAISLNGSLATGNANFYSNYGGTSLVINRPTGGSVSFRENNAIQMYLEGTTGNFGVGTSTPYRRLSVQGSAGISGDLAAANVVATGTLQVAGQTTLASSLTGLLKGTTGVVSNAIAGTDYIAGGAGAATTTLTISGPFTTSATPVVFGSSPITSTYYGLATTSALTSSQLLVSNGAAGVYGVSTTSATINNGLTGTLTTLGSGQTIGLAAIAANTVLANATGGSAVPTAIATSTFFGTGTGGQTLTWNNGVPQWVSTTTAGTGLTYNAGSPGNFSVNTSQNISTLSNLTSNGLIKTSGGTGALSIATAGTDYIAGGAGAATSTVTCAGTASCTSFVAFAASPITITGSGLSSYDAFTHPNTLGYSATTSVIGIGTTTPQWALTIASSTRSQLTLSDGSLTSAPYNFRSINGNFYLSTSSPTTFATSSVSALAINTNSDVTIAHALSVFGSGTTGSTVMFDVGSGQFAVNPNGVAIGGDQTPDAMLEVIGGQFLLSSDSSAGNNGNRLSFDSASGFNGIGTTSSRWALAIASSTRPQLTLSDASATAAPFNFRAINSTLYISTSSPTTFATTTSSFASFNSSTGSTTLLKLDVTGTATSSFGAGINLTAGCFAIAGTCVGGSSFSNTLANGGTATTTFYNGGVVFSDGTKLTQAPHSGTSAFFWDNTNSRLGIGTTSPYRALSIVGNAVFQGANQQLEIVGATVANGAWAFQNVDSDERFRIFDTQNGAERFTVDSAGDIGIGSSTPYAKLSVTNTGSGPSFIVEDSTSPDSTPFIIDASGNVGIGTTSPSSTLTVAGVIRSWTNFASLEAIAANGSGFRWALDGSNNFLLQGTTNAFSGVSVTPMTASLSTGYVGIGTTSPTRNLTVYAASTARISVDSNADGNPGFELYEGNVRKWLLFNNTDDSFRIRDGGSSDFLTITSTGNVGIGIAGSAQTLHVASAGTREGLPSSALFSDTTDTTEGLFLGYSSTGNYGIIAASRLGTAWHNLALAPSGGNVGIGSTSPNANLTVQSSGSVGNVAMGTWASNSGYGAIYLNSAFANGSNYNFLSAIGDALYINRPSATAIRFREANGGTDQFTLNSGGGSIFPDGNLSVCTGGACPSGTPAGNGNIIAETAIGVASSTPWAGLAIASGKAIVVAENTLATSTSMTVDWRNGNQQLVRTGTSATTISFSGFIEGQKLVLTVCNPNATAGAISWGTQVLWAGGTAPTQTTTANKCDVWSFLATTATSTLKIFGTQSANF